MDWRASAIGLGAGVLVGLTGIGTGSLTLPLLVLWLGIPPLQAIGSDLAYSAVTKLVGAVEHTRLGTVDYRTVWTLAAGSVPAAVLAGWWITRSAGHPAMGGGAPGRILGFALILSAAVLLQRLLRRGHGRPPRRAPPHVLAIGGALVGTVVGATAVGSGTLGTSVLAFTTRLEGRRIVGTVVVHAMVLTVAGAATHLAAGTVRVDLVAALVAGSVPGVILGSRLTVRTPEPLLRGVLAALLLLVGVRLQLPRPAAAAPVESSAPAGLPDRPAVAAPPRTGSWPGPSPDPSPTSSPGEPMPYVLTEPSVPPTADVTEQDHEIATGGAA